VVSFETDEPADFLDLVMELREAKTSLYTLRDTPIFTCVSLSLRDTLDTLGAPGDLAALGMPAADGWTQVATTTELPDGTSKLAYVAGEQVALFNAGGKFYALANRCPHANGPLVDGVLEGATVSCPLHESRFDLETGEPLKGPTSRPAKVFAVKIEGDAILVAPRVATPA
jgi:nitrite reductase/ring-hydroxylating ferredoxin subunit